MSRTSLESPASLFAPRAFIDKDDVGPLFMVALGGGVGADICIGDGELPGIPLILDLDTSQL